MERAKKMTLVTRSLCLAEILLAVLTAEHDTALCDLEADRKSVLAHTDREVVLFVQSAVASFQNHR